MYDPCGCNSLISACHPSLVVSAAETAAELYATSRGLVVAPAHSLPVSVNRSVSPDPREVSLVVYPKYPVFTLAEDPAGDDHTVGVAFVPENLSILLDDAERGGSASVLTLILYPFAAFVVTATSCAATFEVPSASVPKGIVDAVESVTVIDAPLTEPEFAAATVKVKVGPSDAVTASDVEVKIANATVPESIVVEPVSEYVVMRAKNVLSVVEGLVIPEKSSVTACVDCVEGVVTTIRIEFAAGAEVVLPVPAKLSLSSATELVERPVGAVQLPEAVVQSDISTCFMDVVAVVVNAKSYSTEVASARESEIVNFEAVRVPA